MNQASFEPYLPIYEDALRMYEGGGIPRGTSTGWPMLDEYYTVGQGQTTIITGVPGSGKSEFIDALCVNLSEQEDWLFAMYSPENFPTARHLVKLAEKRARKPFGEGPRPRMIKSEFMESAFWVMDRFMWLATDLKAPDKLIQTALDYIQPGRKLGVILDPWNTLEHQRGTMSETDYTSFILTECIKLCRVTNAHIWLGVHPAKLPRNKDGTRPIPGPYDISGSAHWYNKPDNILCIHRDQNDASKDQDVEIHVQKVRFKAMGRTGGITLKYDRATGRYFEIYHPIPGDRYSDPEAGCPPPRDLRKPAKPEREPGQDDEEQAA